MAVRADAVLKPFNRHILSVISHLFVTYKTTEILIVCCSHLIWSNLLGYFEPFPFKLTLAIYPSYLVVFIKLWFLVPKQMRMDSVFQKRSMDFVYFNLWSLVVNLQLTGMTSLFDKLNWKRL